MQIFSARLSWRIPSLTLVTLLLVGLIAALFSVHFIAPDALPLLERDRSILQRGEIWRAVTALFFQGPWGPGLAFNATILLALGAVAEQCLNRRYWLAIYLGGGVMTEFLALAWQPQGSGNSVAVFALAGGAKR